MSAFIVLSVNLYPVHTQTFKLVTNCLRIKLVYSDYPVHTQTFKLVTNCLRIKLVYSDQCERQVSGFIPLKVWSKPVHLNLPFRWSETVQ